MHTSNAVTVKLQLLVFPLVSVAVHVTVVTPSGTSNTGSADQFTATAPSLPTVTNLSTSSGSTGGGTLVTSVYSDDARWVGDFLTRGGSTTGRLYWGSTGSAGDAPGSGIALPQTLHGGPGRAGGGEELGGTVGLKPYLQRVALQGSRASIDGFIGGDAHGKRRALIDADEFLGQDHQRGAAARRSAQPVALTQRHIEPCDANPVGLSRAAHFDGALHRNDAPDHRGTTRLGRFRGETASRSDTHQDQCSSAQLPQQMPTAKAICGRDGSHRFFPRFIILVLK